MRFGLIANVKRTGAEEAIEFFVRWAEKSGTELVLCDELSGFQHNSFPFVPKNKIASQVDILVSMGGDGTLLASARAVGNSGTPLLGINIATYS